MSRDEVKDARVSFIRRIPSRFLSSSRDVASKI